MDDAERLKQEISAAPCRSAGVKLLDQAYRGWIFAMPDDAERERLLGDLIDIVNELPD